MEKAKTTISTNSHGKKLQITSFFSRSQTRGVCSLERKLVLFVFCT